MSSPPPIGNFINTEDDFFTFSLPIEDEGFDLSAFLLEENLASAEQTNDLASELFVEQENLILAEPSFDKACSSENRQKVKKNKKLKGFEINGAKQDHNAKERARRMQLNEAYLTLATLLPNDPSKKSKKRWTAPKIVDRVIEYIPEIKEEIEKLTVEKSKMLSIIEDMKSKRQNPHAQQDEDEDPTVSLHQVRKDEVIIQICMKREAKKEDVFSNLLHNIEDEDGMTIVNASTLCLCGDVERICCVLHVEINESLCGDELGVVREKVISWCKNSKL